MIVQGSALWNYLSADQRMLAGDGAFLVYDSKENRDEPTDYSYLVFPYAKLYEGFLKDLFLDLQIISDRDYHSNHYRIGKSLSPNLIRRLGENSAYGQIQSQYGHDVAEYLWRAWKEGRNLVFHYFPHNFRRLTREEAVKTIELLVNAMTQAIERTHVKRTA